MEVQQNNEIVYSGPIYKKGYNEGIDDFVKMVKQTMKTLGRPLTSRELDNIRRDVKLI